MGAFPPVKTVSALVDRWCFKLIIATGMRRGECCGLKWSDIDFKNRAIHVQRNVVKITGEEIFNTI